MKPFDIDKEPKIKSGFTTPESYFDGFTEKLMLQLPAQEIKVIPLYKRTSVWISSIAAVIIIAIAITVVLKNQQPALQPDDNAIESYLVYQADINNYEIIQSLDQTDINELEASITVSEEAIENYFSNENYEIYINE